MNWLLLLLFAGLTTDFRLDTLQRRTLEQRRQKAAEHLETNARQDHDRDVASAPSNNKGGLAAPSRRTAKQPVFASLGDARTPVAPWSSACVAASRSATVKKPQRESSANEKPPLQAHSTKPKTMASKAQPTPLPPPPPQRARLPSASSSKKSIDWFDDEAFTF